MATFGHMFRAVVPENEQACAEIGWTPLHVMRGYRPEDNVVTLTSIRAVSDPFAPGGENVERHLEYIVDWAKRMIEPYQSAQGYVETHVLLLTPIIASLIAKAGYSKEDVAEYLMKNTVTPAHRFEWNLAVRNSHPRPGTTVNDLVEKGVLPKEWGISPDPNRMVPLLLPSSKWLVVVSGDPTRNRCCIYRQNFKQGYATSRKIELPAKWHELLAESAH